jgi:ferredoxin
MTPVIKKELCIECGECNKACPLNPPVIQMENGKYIVKRMGACIECGACVVACPTDAVSI